MTKHIHAENIIAFGQDALTTDHPELLWEYRPRGSSGPWFGMQEGSALFWSPSAEYRRKQQRLVKTVTLDIPMPLRAAPAGGVAWLVNALDPDVPIRRALSINSTSGQHLQEGLLHATPEAAIEHANALVALTREGGS